MLPSLRTILELPVVRSAHPELLGGEAHGRAAKVLDSPVRWVHVSELLDIAGLLSGGELVLSTGLQLEKEPQQIASYVRSLEDAGAAGLMLELTAPMPGTTSALLAAAATSRLPVVVVHRRVRFVEITETVHRLIVAEQLEKVERSRDVHEVFTALSLESAGTSQVVDQAATMIGTAVILEDLQHHVVAHNALGASTVELLDDWERRSRSTSSKPAAGVSSGGRRGIENWLVVPVGIQAQVWGRLVVPRASAGHADDEMTLMILERAAQTLAINRLAERDQRGLAEQAQAGLLSALRQPRGLTEAEGLTRAASLGLKRSPYYVPLVFRTASHAGSHTQSGTHTVDPLAGQQQERALLELIELALKTTGGSALTASIESGSLGMILSLPAREREDNILQKLATTLATAAAQQQGAVAPLWVLGVGRHRATLLEAAAGIDQAMHVAETAASLRKHDKPYYRATDIRLGGLLALIRNDPRVQQFAESELEPLLAADAQGNAGYLELLSKYLDSGGNKAALARSGYLSRPTLYARLAKLEDLLEVDLDDPESRTSLHVALMLHRLRGN